MKTNMKLMQLVVLTAALLPQLSFAEPRPINTKSRKLSNDTVTTSTTYQSTSPMASVSYNPSPIVTTTTIPNAPANNSGQMLMAAVIPMAMGLMGNMNFGSDSSGESESRSNSNIVDGGNSRPAQDTVATNTENIVDVSEAPEDDGGAKDALIPPAQSGTGKNRMYKSGELASMKRDPDAAAGACLAPVTSLNDAKAILSKMGVTAAPGTNSIQLVSLATGIQQISLLNGGAPSRYIQGAVFKFPKVSRYSSQTTSGILMGANHHDGNVAHLMHELGHYAGHQGLYAKYKQLGRCNLTNYSNKNYSAETARNEEFAESWAAFITRPDMLKTSGNPNCKAAFAMFAKEFPNAQRLAVCNRAMLLSEVRSGGQVQMASNAGGSKEEGGFH